MGEQLLAWVPRMAPAQFSVALKSSGRAAGESLWHPLQPWREERSREEVGFSAPSFTLLGGALRGDFQAAHPGLGMSKEGAEAA